MVYAFRVQRVTLSGTMFGGAEEWSTGFFLGQEGSDVADASQLTADAIRNAWITFFTNAGTAISNAYAFTQCKVAAIGADGHTELDQVYYSYPTSATVGASAGSIQAPQVALVATLLSGTPRGKGSKGRMYLPGCTLAPASATGKLPSVSIGNIATNLKTFFDTLDGSFDVPQQLILAARGTGLIPGLNARNDFVETIRVGDVYDTQRRRRNQLVETYTSRVLA